MEMCGLVLGAFWTSPAHGMVADVVHWKAKQNKVTNICGQHLCGQGVPIQEHLYYISTIEDSHYVTDVLLKQIFVHH